MDLPPELRAALDRLLAHVPASELAPRAETQSDTYRRRADHGLDDLLVRTEADALAYAAWRLPATFGAAGAALAEVARLRPDLAPRTHLDLGAGPGTAILAAASAFGTIDAAAALEGAEAFRRVGRRLFDEAGAAAPATDWHRAELADAATIDAALGRAQPDRFDLVTLCYVTGELAPPARAPLVDAAWARTASVFVMVEPGTTAGHHRVLAARERLVAAGAHVVGPCPHATACPLAPPDWCHFAVRVARSRAHRRVKGAELGFEDEKLAWLAVARAPGSAAPARLLRPAQVTKGAIHLELCAASGEAHGVRVPRRARDAYKAAKKLRWGDAVPSELLAEARPVDGAGGAGARRRR